MKIKCKIVDLQKTIESIKDWRGYYFGDHYEKNKKADYQQSKEHIQTKRLMVKGWDVNTDDWKDLRWLKKQNLQSEDE